MKKQNQLGQINNIRKVLGLNMKTKKKYFKVPKLYLISSFYPLLTFYTIPNQISQWAIESILFLEKPNPNGDYDPTLRLLQVRRQPNRRRNLLLHRPSLRSHLLDPNLPHELLQVPQTLHRPGREEARDDEDREPFLQADDQEIEDEEDRPRRDEPEGVEPRSVVIQVQIGSRGGARAIRRLRAAELAVRRESRGQAPVPPDRDREEDES